MSNCGRLDKSFLPSELNISVDAYGNVTIYEPEIFVSGSGVVMKPDSPATILAQFKIFTKTGMI